MNALTILLPALASLRGGIKAAPLLARALGRADALEPGRVGREAQLLRHFEVLPRRIAAAPITRAVDAGDGHYGAWLRCDPAHVRADLGMGRMLACGTRLGLSQDEADDFLAPLKSMFGDEGFPVSAPCPHRWYLMLPADAQLPPFSMPHEALGEDLRKHLPQGPAGQRWVRLMNEAQIVLHNHPRNGQRIAAKLLPVNSLWFWGAGQLPDQVRCDYKLVKTTDALVSGLCRLAGAVCVVLDRVDELDSAAAGATLIDAPNLRDVAEIERDLLPQAQALLARGGGSSFTFDFADGRAWRLKHGQRWRFWKGSVQDTSS